MPGFKQVVPNREREPEGAPGDGRFSHTSPVALSTANNTYSMSHAFVGSTPSNAPAGAKIIETVANVCHLPEDDLGTYQALR